MLDPARGSALLLLLLLAGAWSACSGEDATHVQAAAGAGGDDNTATGTIAGAAASAGAGHAVAGGMPSSDTAGAMATDCGPIPPPNAWASWQVPDPEGAGGAGGETAQRYTLTDDAATDAVTGLTWQRRTAPEPLDWQAATRYCACLTLDEHDDWTLPSRLELVSIVDYTRQNPALDAEAFPETPFEWFWSASRTAESNERYWYVAFWDGNTHAATTDQLYWARCVRQSAGSLPRYDLSVAGVVRDTSTELTWQRAASTERVAWDDAVRACAALELEGQGWRLPNMKELQTLVDESRASPAIDAQAFPGAPGEGFWAATLLADSANSAWFVSFDEGIAYNALTTHLYRYRCVR
jgi:hypothetical protein